MHEVPIRGADGTIAHFVDPRMLEEPQYSAQEEQEVGEEPTQRRTHALRPEERKPLGELLGPSSAPSKQPHSNRSFTTGMAAGLIGALIVAGLVLASRSPASVPVVPTTSARATVSTPASTTSVVVAIAPPTLGRALVAYAAPDDGVVGAISPDRAITLTGTFGNSWIQLQTADSGQVWVKKVELPSTVLDPVELARLPDLAPPPTATALPAPTVAPVTRPAAPASANAVDRMPVGAPVSGCTPDRVVAIVERGATQIASCISLADAQQSLPNATVIASRPEQAQAFYARVTRDATAFAQP